MRTRGCVNFKILIIYLIFLNLNIKTYKLLIAPLSVAAATTCKLPTAAKELLIAKHAITDVEITSGTEVPKNTPLTFSCKTGYNLKGLNNTICGSEGQWTKALPTCVSFCTDQYPRSGFSTQPHFVYNGIDVSRAKLFEPNTTATISCTESFYKPMYRKDTLECTENGWLGTKKPCKMQCGQPIAPITPFSIGGSDVKITEVPWHVGIYRETEGEYENICSGVLISPRVVITAAHCFFVSQRTELMNNFTKFSVAAGKYYREYTNEKGPTIPAIEKRKIIDIWTPASYAGRRGTLLGDIAILKLDQFIPFSETIRPVCLLPFEEARDIELGDITGKLSSWSQPNFKEPYSILKVFHMSGISLKICNETLMEQFQYGLPADKFCVAPFDSSAFACKGDSGSGYVFKNPKTNEYVLNGIVSFSPKPTQACSQHNLLILTNVFYYHEIIEKFKHEDLLQDVEGYSEKNEAKRVCKLTGNTENMIIRSDHTKKRLNAEDEIPRGTSITFACEDGYELSGSNEKLCFDFGFFYPLPLCIPKKCQSKSMVCRPFNECSDYNKTAGSDFNKLEWCHRSKRIACCPRTRPYEKACEKWREKVYTENPCRFWAPTLGKPVEPKQFPHLALLGTKKDNKYKWHCGGALISPNFVLTAATCIAGNGAIPNLVRLGEVNSNSTIDATFPQESLIKKTTDGAFIQEFTVKNSLAHPKYKPAIDYFNIALIELGGEAILNEYVVPSCLPSTIDSLHIDLNGGGYGVPHENDVYARHLLIKRFKDMQCGNYRDSTALPQGPNLTTQFCTKLSLYKPPHCNRDIGGPLFDDHPYYNCMFELQGITLRETSTCGARDADVVTRVFFYVDWIESIVWNSTDLE